MERGPVVRVPSVQRLSASGLLIVGVACGVLAVGAGTTPQAGATRWHTGLATPLWSPRRVPGAVVDAAQTQEEAAAASRLQASLDTDVARYGEACFVVSDGVTILASHNPQAPLIPASTQKLLTAAAALERLGPGFRYTTRVVGDPAIAAVDQLWLVGSGDPVLRTADRIDVGVSTPFDALADQIAASGIHQVGRIVADDSRYDDQRFVPTWKPSYRRDFDVSPLGALTVNQSTTVGTGAPVMADDPTIYAASELTRLLRGRGVTVLSDPVRGSPPPAALTIASVSSQPLARLVSWMFLTSDNLTAELLTKELGVRVNGAGTTTAGVDAIRATLTNLGVPLDGQTMTDGSGLDRGNRLTCATLRAVINLDDQPGLSALRAALPPPPPPPQAPTSTPRVATSTT